jgi:hypothetical protein
MTWMPGQTSEVAFASNSLPTSEKGPNFVVAGRTERSSANRAAVIRRSRTQSAAVGITSKLPSPRPVPMVISPSRMRGMNQLRTVRRAEETQGRRAVTRQ